MKGALNAYAKNQDRHILVTHIPAPDLDAACVGRRQGKRRTEHQKRHQGVVPDSLLVIADCIIVLPSVKKFAVGVGGSGGRGSMTC